MIKIIFLDMDGVLAIPRDNDGMWEIREDKQDLLEYILKETNAKIVLSSSWRSHNLETTINYLKKNGFRFCDKLIDITIWAYSYLRKDRDVRMSIPRGVEINQWIDWNIHSNKGKDWNRKELNKDYTFIILDDDSDMLLSQKDNFLHCYWKDGLTKELADKAIKILNGELNNETTSNNSKD